ncbi:VOC family protein [Tenggerimyces flavus]|uniref:VOC family protein n=1 Tax=Tenggerimyces flavus TaxID=1708749 RepID=A0ABV7YAL8_9ACTN|nr:VOC family protein [Tenggerimyces flavus]MBM7786162.1 catechol 2,3-dioxygenase-like lactoylglutathione lyase family enzyme [Tenggerimyces flavus]
MTDERLTAKQFQDSDGVEDWRVLAFGANAWFDAPSHAAGAELVRRIADLGGRQPDVNLRASGVHVRIPSPPDLTTADVELARQISAAARDLGRAADPSAVQDVQVTIDVLDKAAVVPFWQTALGYDLVGDDDLVDPMRRHPAIWFQQQSDPRPLRNRIHLDIVRPNALAADGVEAVGGRATGVIEVGLADAEGNEADVIPLGPAERLEAPETADWSGPFAGMVFYPVSSPQQGAEVAAVAAGMADEAGMPMMIDLRPGGVLLDTGKDQEWNDPFPELARKIQAAARGMGLAADPAPLRFVQVGIDAADVPVLRHFWRTVLGYEEDQREHVTDLFDPRRLNAPVFFLEIDTSEEDRRKQRNRIHVDVFVPNDQAQARIDAALAAGGRIVYDAEAPEWWTLADPEGNEVDIAVSVGREELWQERAGA